MPALSPRGLLDLLLGWFQLPMIDQDESRVFFPRPNAESEGEPTVRPVLSDVRCGAWAGWASMANDAAVKRNIAVATKVGLTRLDVIINDHSASRSPRLYDTYLQNRIVALCKAAHDAGLEVHVTSWVMPHRAYIERMALELRKIAERAKITSFTLDAEEPWTLARSPMPWLEAAELVKGSLADLRWGVTGIGYASPTKLGPLIRRAAYALPQCYATNNPNSARPEDTAPRYVARWREVFDVDNVVVGLAVYNQRGIPGHSVESAIRAAYQGARSVAPGSDISWWSLSAIRTDVTVQKAVKAVTALVEAERGRPIA